MRNDRGKRTGLLLLLGFVLLSSSKAVFLAAFIQNTDPLLVLFLTFGLASLFFNLIQVPSFGAYAKGFRSSLPTLAQLNVATVSCWVSYFYSIKYLEPAVYAAVAHSTGPFLTLCAVAWLQPDGGTPRRNELVAALGIMAGVAVLVFSTCAGHTAVGSLPTEHLLLGLGMAFLCGLSIVWITFLSNRLNGVGWGASQIMAARFFGLLAGTWLLIPSGSVAQLLEAGGGPVIVLIAILGVIVPLYCSQLGIEKCSDPMAVALMLALIPLCMFGVQALDRRLHLSYFSLAGILTTLVFTGIGIRYRFRWTSRTRIVAEEPEGKASLVREAPPLRV